MSDLWTRLKQRKLVQWSVAYTAFAFALLQGIDIVAQQFAWPESVRRGITLALALGFFVTLLLAWYHGEKGRQRVSGTELLLIALLLGFGGAFLWRMSAAPATSRTASGRLLPTHARTVASPSDLPVTDRTSIPEKSIAVLPFVNEGGSRNERFFSDGLSEDLITALAQLHGLKVISSNSSFRFRNSTQSVATIARELGVAHLLEGGVRRLGSVVRIRAELINASDGSTLWARQYDRPYKDLFKLQDDITHAVAEALKTRLLEHSAQSDRPPSGSLDAYLAVLKARAQPFNADGMRRRLRLYDKAIRIDPDYAYSYASKAGILLNLAGQVASTPEERQQFINQSRIAADRAQRLDPELIAARSAQVDQLAFADFDWQGALDEAKHMMALAPNNTFSLSQMASMQRIQGHPKEAERLDRELIARDPLSPFRYTHLARDLRGQGRLKDASAALRKAITLAPYAIWNHARLAIVELLLGHHAAAVAAAESEPPGIWHDFANALVKQEGTDRAAADAALRSMIETAHDTGPYQIAEIYALRKDPDNMFRWLDRAWEERDVGIMALVSDPLIRPYHGDPRYAAYCRKVGLPGPGSMNNTHG